MSGIDQQHCIGKSTLSISDSTNGCYCSGSDALNYFKALTRRRTPGETGESER